MWWRQQQAALTRNDNLSVVAIDPESSTALARLLSRTMRLSATVQHAQVWIGSGTEGVAVDPEWWLRAAAI